MSTLWIVHREPQRRAGLARAAAAPDGTVSGGPSDPLFDISAPADVVLLGVAGDLEAELEFAHRISERHPRTRWVIVAERSDAAAARELFDSIDAEVLTFPPDARLLRASLRRAAAPPRQLALSRRPARDQLAQRFSRWFADLELPELLHAIDPQLADAPLLIWGEDGTGRGLLARYLHSFGPERADHFAHVPCSAAMGGAQLRGALADATREVDTPCTIWLDQLDALPIGAQRELARWIEFGPPLHCRVARWVATAGDERAAGEGVELEPGLRDAICGISIRLPSVRERPQLIAGFANATAMAWTSARRQKPRRFGEDAIAVLEEYPWPGNLRELEAVVGQTLAGGASDPIRADDLRYDGSAFAPLDVSAQAPQRDADERPAPEPTLPPEPAAADADREFPQPAGGPADGASDPACLPATRSSELGGGELQRLVGAISHEIRNPLSTIRTFAELLPSRYDDADFRETFSELVGHDARRIETVVSGLTGLASLAPPHPVRVDLAALLEELLEDRRMRVHARKLLVLKELQADAPPALVDAGQMRIALDSILDKSIELAPERGDVYIAARHNPEGLRGGPAVRVLIRFGQRTPAAARSAPTARAASSAGLSTAENSLDFAIAEAVVRSQGGTFAIHVGDGDETVAVLDVPAARS